MKPFESFSEQKKDGSIQDKLTPKVEGGRVTSSKEAILLEREIVIKKKIKGGNIGDAHFVELKNDGNGIFKPHTKYSKEIAAKYINRERAAYLISLFLGFNLVPPTVIRKIDGRLGSMQEFIDAKTAYELGDDILINVPESEYLKMFIFDFLIENTDRRLPNYLVKDNKIYAIDNGLSLHITDLTFDSVPITLVDEVLPKSLIGTLKKFISSENSKAVLKQLLYELLDKETIEMFIKRVGAFVKAITTECTLSEHQFKLHLYGQV